MGGMRPQCGQRGREGEGVWMRDGDDRVAIAPVSFSSASRATARQGRAMMYGRFSFVEVLKIVASAPKVAGYEFRIGKAS